MSTMAQLIDRLKRDWLEAADSQPTRFTLAAAITSKTALTFTFNDALLAPEELDMLGPGTLVEFGGEEMILADIDEGENTATVAIRGANGTSASTHLIGAEGVVAPLWRRKVIFDALADAIVALYPDLYTVATTTLSVSTSTFTEIPEDIGSPLYFHGTSQGAGGYDTYPVSFHDHFGPSSTGKAISVDAPFGVTGYLVYKAGFVRPEEETDDVVDDIGLDPQWEQIILVAAAAYLMAGREFEQVDQERLTKQLERQGFPVLTATRIRQSLLQYRDQLMDKAKDALRSREPTQIQYTSGL